MTALMGIDTRLRLARLYLCTDARDRQGDLAEFCEAVCAGGVDVIQLRQPGLDPDRALDLLAEMRRITQPHQVLVAVDGSVEVAGRARSEVLHLPPAGADLPGGPDAVAVRPRLQRWARIGRSAHDAAAFAAGLADPGIDYLSIGPVWATPTVPDAPATGLDLVRDAARLAPPGDSTAKPWFAVGGIAADTVDRVLDAGARRIVVVRAICDADDPGHAARELKDRLRQAWAADPAMDEYVLAVTRS